VCVCVCVCVCVDTKFIMKFCRNEATHFGDSSFVGRENNITMNFREKVRI
jgi:hypothetical protein